MKILAVILEKGIDFSGELRPRFLDRFGLSLAVSRLTDSGMRQAVTRRRMAFDRNPEGFAGRWTEAQALSAQQQVAQPGAAMAVDAIDGAVAGSQKPAP